MVYNGLATSSTSSSPRIHRCISLGPMDLCTFRVLRGPQWERDWGDTTSLCNTKSSVISHLVTEMAASAPVLVVWEGIVSRNMLADVVASCRITWCCHLKVPLCWRAVRLCVGPSDGSWLSRFLVGGCLSHCSWITSSQLFVRLLVVSKGSPLQVDGFKYTNALESEFWKWHPLQERLM